MPTKQVHGLPAPRVRLDFTAQIITLHQFPLSLQASTCTCAFERHPNHKKERFLKTPFLPSSRSAQSVRSSGYGRVPARRRAVETKPKPKRSKKKTSRPGWNDSQTDLDAKYKLSTTEEVGHSHTRPPPITPPLCCDNSHAPPLG